MILELETIEGPERPDSTIWTGTGVNVETDRRYRFVGDQRCMRDFAVGLANGYSIPVEVENWQLLGEIQ